MTIEKLERVMWRLRSEQPHGNTFPNKRLRVAVMYEIGTDSRTYHKTREALKELGWIKTVGKVHFELSGKDIGS